MRVLVTVNLVTLHHFVHRLAIGTFSVLRSTVRFGLIFVSCILGLLVCEGVAEVTSRVESSLLGDIQSFLGPNYIANQFPLLVVELIKRSVKSC